MAESVDIEMDGQISESPFVFDKKKPTMKRIKNPLVAIRGFKDHIRAGRNRKPSAGHTGGHSGGHSTAAREKENIQRQRVFQSNPLFKAVLENDINTLDQIVELFKDGKIMLDGRGAVGDTALHVAVLFGNLEAATRLMDADPKLVNMPNDGWLYKGETALHISIINQDFAILKELVRRGADVAEPRALGHFFQPGKGIHCYYGEYPLSFAVCTGQEEIVTYLVEKGACLDARDTYGNTALHMLPTMPNKELAIKMFDVLTDLNEKNENKKKLEWIENNHGYTLVKMAADLGNYELFAHLMERRKQIHWTYGPVTSAVYDLNQLDTCNETKSVLELLVKSSKPEEAGRMLDVTPVKQLLARKWEECCRKWFYAWVAAYLFYIVVFSLVCYNRPVSKMLDSQNRTVIKQRPFKYSYVNQEDYWRALGEVVVILGVISMMTMEIPDLVRKGVKGYFRLSGSGPFHGVIWGYVICILIVIVMRVSDYEWEEIPMSLALVLCWMYFMFFSRGWEKTGPFSVMVQKMIFGDLVRFFAVFSVALIGYSAALYNMFRETYPTDPNFGTVGLSVYTLFELMLGMSEITGITHPKGPANVTTVLLLCSYLVFAYVLLINLLIALMGHTYKKVSKERERFWKIQMADLTLLIERRLPRRFQKRSGICGKVFGLGKDNWYIRIEEKGNMSQKIHRSFLPDKATCAADDDIDGDVANMPSLRFNNDDDDIWAKWSPLLLNRKLPLNTGPLGDTTRVTGPLGDTTRVTETTTSGPQKFAKEQIQEFVSADGRERKQVHIVQTRQRERRIVRSQPSDISL